MKNINYIISNDYKRIYPNGLRFTIRIKNIITKDITYIKWKYIKYMRISNELQFNNNLFNNLKKIIYDRLRNKFGMLLGYEIYSSHIGEGLCLYHNGPIVINKNSIIGKNCSLHGDNCIGNDGITDDCPIIGDNVEIGVGAKNIGKIKIANNVIVGAGAVVVNDILQENSIVAGVPAKIIKKK